ncbi:ThuA domain-containing protein [Cellulosimicrobium terreum]|nr:ThuA domain-containing protein [Cellulosimicrobium terreum]
MTVTSPTTPDGSRAPAALVVRGGWEGHRPQETTDLFVRFLSAHGYVVRVEPSPAVYADAHTMAGVDLVVQCVTMGEITSAQVAGLSTAVEAGTGLAGWHGGIVDSYRASSEYAHLVGGQFAHHPRRTSGPSTPLGELRGDETDSFVTHTVRVVPEQAQHPVVAGIEEFELTTEQYWVLTDDYDDVLATTTVEARPDDPWHRPSTSPAVWTRRWGAGKVFVCTAGHRPEDLEHPDVRRIVERGLLWASRQEHAL